MRRGAAYAARATELLSFNFLGWAFYRIARPDPLTALQNPRRNQYTPLYPGNPVLVRPTRHAVLLPCRPRSFSQLYTDCIGYQMPSSPRPTCRLVRVLSPRSISRSDSAFAMASRLSYCFLPRHRPTSTLTR